MSMEQILETLRSFDGVLELAPAEGSAFPEIAWGDHFFYYAPDGRVPEREQPYATIVTKNYPDEVTRELEPPGRWRLNIHVGTDVLVGLTGEDPRDEQGVQEPAPDTVVPHPVYRRQGWVAIVDPGVRTQALATRLLQRAHEDARRRAGRRRPDRAGSGDGGER